MSIPTLNQFQNNLERVGKGKVRPIILVIMFKSSLKKSFKFLTPVRFHCRSWQNL